MSNDGEVWASPFEHKVYEALKASGRYDVRRATERDTLAYSTSVRGGYCPQCGSHTVVQERTYTPDLLLGPQDGSDHAGSFYVEVKGYFPGPKRNLFRAVKAAHPDADIRLVVQQDHWVTKGKTRLSDWAKRYKVRFHKWNGSLPEDW